MIGKFRYLVIEGYTNKDEVVFFKTKEEAIKYAKTFKHHNRPMRICKQLSINIT